MPTEAIRLKILVSMSTCSGMPVKPLINVLGVGGIGGGGTLGTLGTLGSLGPLGSLESLRSLGSSLGTPSSIRALIILGGRG